MTMQSATREPIFKEPGGIREPQRAALTNKADVSFNTVEQIDQDSDLWFQIRGYGYNPLVDASLPIIGLVMRIRSSTKIRMGESIPRCATRSPPWRGDAPA